MTQPGEFVPEYIVTATDMNALPGGTLGYAEVTADQATITTEVDLTGLSVTVDVVANRRIKISAQTHIRGTTAENTGTLRIKESTTTLNSATSFWTRTNADGLLVCTKIHDAPSAGSHTYKLTLEMVTGTGSIDMKATTSQRAFILVEDIGPV